MIVTTYTNTTIMFHYWHYDPVSSLLLLLLLMDKNCLAVQDCQARQQAFESAHILLFTINHQDSS